MRGKSCWKYIVLPMVALMLCGGAWASNDIGMSLFDKEQFNIRYHTVSMEAGGERIFASTDDFAFEAVSESGPSYKSPTKAFLLSLAVPGLGQYYYGSKVKPFVFLGAEVASWVFYFKWHNEGDDITAEYEAFNHAHWSRDDYEWYLEMVYGVTDDDDLPIGTRGVTHHLPDNFTQQFYEMTGKYDQFSWGWDDAVLEGYTLDDYSISNPPDTVLGGNTVPYSANRLYYETLRNDANNAYDRATRMIFVSMANRLVSAFEALITTNRNNKTQNIHADGFGRMKVRATLKSCYAKSDTPFITVTCKF